MKMYMNVFYFVFLIGMCTTNSLGEFSCFRKFRSKRQTCGGLLKNRVVSSAEECCAKRGQGFSVQTPSLIGPNKYTCTPCSVLEKGNRSSGTDVTETPPIKQEFVCFRKFRAKRSQCGGPKTTMSTNTTVTCCNTNKHGGFSTTGIDPRGKNRYTCISCKEWQNQTNVVTKPAAPTVDGIWAEWEPWEPCSLDCNGGVRRRVRNCDSPAPTHGGQDCNGRYEETESCNDHECYADGSWGPWSRGVCSWHGIRMERVRHCNRPAPSGGGKPCRGRYEKLEKCRNEDRSINGGWSHWHSMSKCSVTCGTGHNTMTRTCDMPRPMYGGKHCKGADTNTTVCSGGPPCPIHGGWSDWTSFGRCRSRTPCSHGYRERSRVCNNPRPQLGGRCWGHWVEKERCFVSAFCPVDGSWCEFKDWSSCSATCLGSSSTHTRFRACTCPTPKHGGTRCQGDYLETRTCEGASPCDDNAVGLEVKQT